MTVRKIVQIDEEKCDGCGDCIPNCPEGALKIVDGKAKLVRDQYCDGLGACLGVCPQDAITIIERDADEFDEEAVAALQARGSARHAQEHGTLHHGAVCPGAAMIETFAQQQKPAPVEEAGGERPSALTHWPVQLDLAPVDAPFFDGADLLLAADCTPFALADFHEKLLRGRKLLVGCPKLDDSAYYAEKLAAILNQNDIRSLTVVHMEVPCCFGFAGLVERALAASGRQIPVEEVIVSVRGRIKQRRVLAEADEAMALGERVALDVREP
ncbi:MAG: 4Fe-4S dicluster domain-containing protein [Planctomycetes bacterium]|nr:4Fe-4S dicluster domain-containing protein [Planctomycetota bacterium]